MKIDKKEFGKNILSKIYNKIKPILNKKAENDDIETYSKVVVGRHVYKKIIIDLRNDDPEKMYPVKFRHGVPFKYDTMATISEIIIRRVIDEDSDLNNGNPSSNRFSDGGDSSTEVAELLLKIVGGDHPWGGYAYHGTYVKYYNYKVMPTVQLFNTHRMIVYEQAENDTVFNSDTNVKPTGSTPYWSGIYLRGGLKYEFLHKGLWNAPIVYKTPTRVYNNHAYHRSEWVAPYKYSPADNSNIIDTPEYL